MIGYARCHHGSPVSVFFLFLLCLLPQAQMRLDEVIIRKGEMQLLHQPLLRLGKGHRLAHETAVLMADRQIVPLDEARVDRRAHGGLGQLCGHGLPRTKDDARRDLHHPPLFTPLNHLSVQQVRRHFENRLAGAAPHPGSRDLRLDPITGEQGVVIMLEFIGREEWEVAIGAPLDPRHQRVSIGLIVPAHDKVDHNFVAGVEPNPHPLVAIAGGQLFQRREMRFLFLTNDQSSST